MIYIKIKELCKEKGISVYKVEKDLGFSGSSICKWKNSMPSADKLQKVAEYLGVTMDYLIKGKV